MLEFGVQIPLKGSRLGEKKFENFLKFLILQFSKLQGPAGVFVVNSKMKLDGIVSSKRVLRRR